MALTDDSKLVQKAFEIQYFTQNNTLHVDFQTVNFPEMDFTELRVLYNSELYM